MAGGADEAAERFFDGRPSVLEAYRAVRVILDGIGPCQVRVTKSQVSVRRRKAFAWLWLPGRWLRNPGAEVVLSVALGERDLSPRLKEVVNPAPNTWIHHLEIHDLGDLGDEVESWLRRAYDRA